MTPLQRYRVTRFLVLIVAGTATFLVSGFAPLPPDMGRYVAYLGGLMIGYAFAE